MEPQAAGRRAQLVRMDDQDRVSQASSVATISYFPVTKEGDGKVQTFGKRCQAARRDPNCPVVIRGWLNKKDSSGLKLWKRRWFVLSNYCLFYYKDSREESVLGSIPLPSYKILFCTPRECKNRKFTFKVVHQGMRSYFFSADTQEDMLGWVRALSQSAAMEPHSSMNRRCSSYQDFTQIGGSTESVDYPKSPSDGEGAPQIQRHVSRTLSEPSQLTGGRTGQRGRRGVRHRNSSPSYRTPSPHEFSRRRAGGPSQEEDFPPGYITPPMQTDVMGTGSLTPRGQLGSRPHTPVGRVDIRPHDDPIVVPQTLYYAPASPKHEFKSTPNTPVADRWQNLSKPTPTYGSVHHIPSGRRPLAKAPKPDQREAPPIRPLESDADAVLTRLCGCDKLLQSLSVELAQLQLDKNGVHCALEVSRLQLEEWQSQGPRAQEEALTQKALLQEDLVTIRARMCDVSLEMERVWSQYERMESELSVIRSHLQHICNFGMPQEQSQAQRELWMMEDILAGLKANREHFRFLLGLERPHLFQTHPGPPGSPTERLQSDLPMDVELEPPARPPLPQELQDNHQYRDRAYGYTEPASEEIYSHAVGPAHRRGNSQPDLRNVNAPKDASEPQPGSRWIPPEAATQSTKKMKMSEEEQIERMKKNQERLTNRKKSCLSAPGSQTQIQSQSSQAREEAPFPIRVTRVVTAVLPSSLVARRVSVEDPPVELEAPLPEQIPLELHQRAEQGKVLDKSPRQLLQENPDQNWRSVTGRQQNPGVLRSFKKESQPDVGRGKTTENSRHQVEEGATSDRRVEEPPSPAPLNCDVNPDLCLTPEQREAKLRRVERIRERVIRSAVRENATAHMHLPNMGERRAESLDTVGKQRMKTDHRDDGGNVKCAAERQVSSPTSQDENEREGCGKISQSRDKVGNKTQRKDQSERTGVVKTRSKRKDSPYHISSMTVYQKDGGEGFLRRGNEEEKESEEHDAVDENSVSLFDLRAKWFLSTSQWQGCFPLQIPGMDSPCSEEMLGPGAQAACSDDATDSGEMSSAVSESLEKMKENHSLFYKIACDISISDTDITKKDGNGNPNASSEPEEEEKLSIIESAPEEETSDAGRSFNQDGEEGGLNLSPDSESPAKETRVYEEIQQKDDEGMSRQEPQTKVKETNQDALEGCKKQGATQSMVKKSEDEKVDRERLGGLKKSRSLNEENKEDAVQQRGDDNGIAPSGPVYAGGSVVRSASFGKARLTVLRTSL